jgi:hypothetical protein
MDEKQKALEIFRAMETKDAAQQSLDKLHAQNSGFGGLFADKSALSQQAWSIIDKRDAAERTVEESIGSVSAGTRKAIMEAYTERHPDSEYGKNMADMVRKIDEGK